MEVQQKIIWEGRSDETTTEEGRIINHLEERCKKEEILWKQKSRVNWLREGERKTWFFHNAMIQHRQSNKIFSLKYDEGNRSKQHEEMEGILVNHFRDLLT